MYLAYLSAFEGIDNPYMGLHTLPATGCLNHTFADLG